MHLQKRVECIQNILVLWRFKRFRIWNRRHFCNYWPDIFWINLQ